jgi:ATP-dependent helicase HrpA
VTLDVNVREAEALTPAALDWAVPGHLEAKVEHYLRAAAEGAAPRLRAAGGDGARKARSRWEKPEATEWTFGDVPASVPVCDLAGVAVLAYPTLAPGDHGVALKLARSEEESLRLSRLGLGRLLDLQLRYELAWLEKELRALRALGALTATLAPIESIQADAFVSLRRWVTDPGRVAARTKSAFAAALAGAKADLRGVVPRLTDQLREILTLRQTLLVGSRPYTGQLRDLETLLPGNFVRLTPYERLSDLPRYLRAMVSRSERWRQNPAKDAERARQLAPYLVAAGKRAWDDPVRWLVEEFRVSLFAQELGTSEPVSAVKLDRVLAGREDEGRPTPPPAPAVSKPSPTPAPTPAGTPTGAVPPVKKTAPLKDLNALAALFRK